MAPSLLRRSAPLRVLLTLAWIALIYSMQRLLFWRLNADAFPHAPFLALIGGVRFDLSAIAWLNMPWLLLVLINPSPARWYASLQRWVFIIVNSVGFFFNCVDLEYFKFTLKRSTADLFGIATGGSDLWHVMPVFLRDYWYVVLIFIVSIAVAWKGYAFTMRAEVPAETGPSMTRRVLWRSALIAIVVILSRGGVQYIPLAPLDASNYAPPAYIPLVLNSPFTIMTSIGKPVVEEKHYLPQVEADRLWPVIHQYVDTFSAGSPLSEVTLKRPAWNGAKGRPNVVVIVLESFSAAYSSKLSGRPDGCMPFLDSLMGLSVNCTHAYANGRRSIDGIPAVLASMPKLMDEAFITSSYATTPFTSLANTLAGAGYHTSFFHGGHNGTMGFDSFAKSAGFQEYIGRDQYPDAKDDDGVWGIRDRPFFQFFAHVLDKKPQPFCASIFSLSSHHPYELPPEDMKRFAGGSQRIMPTLRYADDALRRFFTTARTMPWFTNTLFVITADHTADLDRDGELSNQAADYWVPVLYYSPSLAPQEVTAVTQQIDILPTALDLIGYPKAFFSFGSSVLREERPPCAVVSNNNIYLAIGERGMLQFDGTNMVPPPMDMTAVPDTRALEAPLKAAIQQFNSHLLHKDLVYSK